jgi:predicted GNAT superfamily acetyltransferase
VIARRYIRDAYGDTGSELHAGIGTDRLVAEWHLRSPRVVARLRAEPSHADDRSESSASMGNEHALEVVRIAVPLDIQSLKRRSLPEALEQRRVTRAAFEDYLGRGWIVADTEQDDVELRYLLRPPGS